MRVLLLQRKKTLVLKISYRTWEDTYTLKHKAKLLTPQKSVMSPTWVRKKKRKAQGITILKITGPWWLSQALRGRFAGISMIRSWWTCWGRLCERGERGGRSFGSIYLREEVGRFGAMKVAWEENREGRGKWEKITSWKQRCEKKMAVNTVQYWESPSHSPRRGHHIWD